MKNFEGNYDVLKWKSQCILLNNEINFIKNGTELKMENPTHLFREKNIRIFRYQKKKKKKKKKYFRHFCCLFLNSPKACNVSLTFAYDYFVKKENEIFWNVLSSIFGYHLLKNFALFIVFAWKALRFTIAFLSFFFAATFPEYLLKIH